MDRLYSLSLLLSLLAGAAAVGLATFSATGLAASVPAARRGSAEARRVGTALAVVSLVCLALSLVVHLVWGHRPGTPEALGLIAFFRIHPSFLAAAGLPLLAVCLRRSR